MKKILLILLLFSACKSPEALLKKAIAKGAKVKTDTVKITVEKITPEVKIDTVFLTKEGDTVYINKDKLKIKYVRLPGDSIFIAGECEADTIKVEVPVAVTTTISAGYSKWEVISLVVILLLIFLGILYLIRRRGNNP